ncbi:hypothetical protein OH76DRAFT_500551 [Lentinus brumalis]|uniref:Uncharacterized protein n=1 Tax=Lentinus brumalis TaxID=2498619 RepID=A0A371DBY1_9APHY|nr:hypothetical protein OH76DRAFT_500551 [Polyporus brumalis]
MNVGPTYYPNSGTFLASAGVPTGASQIPLDFLFSRLPPCRRTWRRIRADERMHARPAQLHCGRRKPGLLQQVGIAQQRVVRRTEGCLRGRPAGRHGRETEGGTGMRELRTCGATMGEGRREKGEGRVKCTTHGMHGGEGRDGMSSIGLHTAGPCRGGATAVDNKD